MNITVISTGEELLRGAVVNTDLAETGRRLLAAHLPVARALTAGDSRASLLEAISDGVRGADVLLISGGLGPTEDDLTRSAAAEFFGLPLVRNADIAGRLRRYYRQHHGTGRIPKGLFSQADVPEGAEVLANANGSAPGLCWQSRYGGRTVQIFLLPGPPHELVPMLEKDVIPRLAAQYCGRNVTARFLVEGAGELDVERRLTEAGCPVERAYCAVPGGTKLFLTGTEEAVQQAGKLAEKLFGKDLSTASDPAEACVRRLARAHLTLGLAESCTGGLIASQITAVSGASEVFSGGIVSYANEVKQQVLGVPEPVLREFGAVSRECALAMAEGAARVLHADIAGAVTGIAGPGGGSPSKPVGLVWIAVAFRGEVTAQECRFRGDRETVRRRSAAALLELIRQRILSEIP